MVDERLKRGGLLSLAERRKLPYAEERIEQFKVYFNEIYAASMLASILYDAGNSLPFEFLYDVAHQCWDEMRRSEFGATRLRKPWRELLGHDLPERLRVSDASLGRVGHRGLAWAGAATVRSCRFMNKPNLCPYCTVSAT